MSSALVCLHCGCRLSVASSSHHSGSLLAPPLHLLLFPMESSFAEIAVGIAVWGRNLEPIAREQQSVIDEVGSSDLFYVIPVIVHPVISEIWCPSHGFDSKVRSRRPCVGDRTYLMLRRCRNVCKAQGDPNIGSRLTPGV